jgi:hypothetical protein
MSDATSQIRAAIAEVDQIIAGAGRAFLSAAAYQSIAHSIALAAQNAVAQQQQSYILRNAIVAAAADAILAGKKAEAEELLKLADSRSVSANLAADIEALLAALRAVEEALEQKQLAAAAR